MIYFHSMARMDGSISFSADEKRELGEEKVNELKQKMAGISAFCDMYEDTNWRYYVGLQ